MTSNGEQTVLLIEDSPADVELVEEVVEQINPQFSIEVAENGREGLAYCRRKPSSNGVTPPDLILLDIDLPHKDGFEVLEDLKTEDNLRRIPVVILTMSNAPRDINRAYDLGASCVVTKPLGFGEFKELFESFEQFWFHHVQFPTGDEEALE
jgi:CheY-like chemotaxis protein